MRKRNVSVEWHVAESEEEWQTFRQKREPSTSAPARTSHMRWGGSLVLIALIVFGLWQRQQGQVADKSLQNSPAESVAVTMVVAEGKETQRTPAPIMEAGGPFNSDVARMLERPEQGIHTFQSVDASLRPVLANALWGAPQELSTTHFLFRFRQLDATTVAEAAPQLEQIYLELWQSWGLATPSNPKLIVQVSEQYLRADLPYFPQRFDQLTVSSPALYPVIAPWQRSDLFIQSVVLLLVDQLLAEAIDYYAIGTARDPVLDGLRLWQLWDLVLPLAEQKMVLAPWLYRALPAVHPGAALPLPENYSRLCFLHALWMTQPVQLRIPLLCVDQDRAALRFSPRVLQNPPRLLPALDFPHYVDEENPDPLHMTLARHPGETVALAIFIDYLVRTQGRAKLPELLVNLNRHRTWHELLLAVYGLSQEKAEAEWQALLPS